MPDTIAPGMSRWLKPGTRFGRVALWSGYFTLACTLLRIIFGGSAFGLFFGGWIPLGATLFAISAGVLLVRAINRNLLWTVRNRLIVTYVLLGFAPVVLFATITAITDYVFAGQFSIDTALSGLNEASDQLGIEASSLAHILTQPQLKKDEPINFEQQSNAREAKISIAVLRDGTWHALPLTTARGTSPASPFDNLPRPAWQGTGFKGVLMMGGKLYLCRTAGAESNGRNAEVLAALELNKEALNSIGNSLGRVLLFAGQSKIGKVEIDGAEQEARTAERDADLADAQREAQRDAQRDAEREQREATRDKVRAQAGAAREVGGAQRELDRAQAEMNRAASSPDSPESPEDKADAAANFAEAQAALHTAQAEAGAAEGMPLPPAPPAPNPGALPKAQSTPGLKPGGHAGIAPPQATATRVSGKRSDPDLASFAAVSGGVLPTANNLLDPRVYFTAPLSISEWKDGEKRSAMLVVISRPSTLYARLFSTSVDMGSLLRNVLIGMAVAFALIVILALWMAFRLSGTITRSVAELYRGTTEIDNGNLGFRVKPQRADQLGALAGSFNRMAGSIQHLLVQQREKDRMLNELAIAQEVQQNLFPQSPVSVSGLQLHAVCLPARSVSGDYFDFIFGHNTLGSGTGACIALGDISGKGISAALLMATLHSAVRAFSLRENSGLPSPAEQLALLNTHLFSSTQANRYATLFLAFYDARTRLLTYANGGHLAPFLISADGTVRRLDVGGPVVGLLENLAYEEATVQLQPGDLLAAFTDGMTEPEDRGENEFGEARLLRLLEERSTLPLPGIADAAFEAVKQWIAAGEQPDDMTLLLARQG